MRIAGTPAHVVAVEEISQVGQARRTAQQLAEGAGFDETDAGRVALVATELASNLLKHGRHGAVYLRCVPGRDAVGVEILAVDRGPGFDLAQCLPDGVSSRGTQGIGLGSVMRQAQVFDHYSDERGSVLLARLYPRVLKEQDHRFGAVQQSLHDDPACGDSWALTCNGDALACMVVDGLGHGPDAQVAAHAAIAAFLASPFGDPSETLADAHSAMTGTRGGAVAIARHERQNGRLRFSGIGNISATLLGPDSSRGLASHPGIVGVQFRRAHTFDFPQSGGQLLVMHSDGLQSRWRLTDYPGLWHRHPAVISAVLHRDFSRGRDDVTVLVIALEAPRG
ncbi:anti-sigma regulatory factor (Ser/Thr protein kinase) [Luteibacter sp. Sphag1AF]|nr:anti-sigma regulatory factor (Ser/Thr protein kinase) [Luteibacter sp. Sphag1AF]